jgi:hypothetical protein
MLALMIDLPDPVPALREAKCEYEAGPLLLEADPKRFLNERESESVQRITQVPPTEHGSHDGNFSMT